MPLFRSPSINELEATRDVAGLVKALRHRDGNVRARAAHALRDVGDLRAVEPLISALRDAEPGVRAAAAWALAQLGDLRAVEPLISALKDEDELVRKAAAQAWTSKELGDDSTRAVEPFIDALKDPSADIRWLAANALGLLGDERAVEPLKSVLESPLEGVAARGPRSALLVPEAKTEDIRKQVIGSLENIGGPEAERALAEYRARH